MLLTSAVYRLAPYIPDDLPAFERITNIADNSNVIEVSQLRAWSVMGKMRRRRGLTLVSIGLISVTSIATTILTMRGLFKGTRAFSRAVLGLIYRFL